MSKSRLLASSLLPKGESPFLTIAIPHYKHRRYLEVVLESIFAQNYDFVTCLYHADRYLLPLGFRVVAKTEYYVDKKDGKRKRRSPISKGGAVVGCYRKCRKLYQFS